MREILRMPDVPMLCNSTELTFHKFHKVKTLNKTDASSCKEMIHIQAKHVSIHFKDYSVTHPKTVRTG